MANLETNAELNADLLAEGVAPSQRAAHISLMVRTARNRRQRIAVARGLALAMVISLALLQLYHPSDTLPAPATTSVTEPNPRQPARVALLATGDFPPVPVISTAHDSVAVLSTRTAIRDVRFLSESELMQLLEGWSVAFIKHPNGAAELLLLNPPPR